jgi:hypothetical protein
MINSFHKQEPSIKDLAYSRLLPYVKLHMPKYMIGLHHRVIAYYLQKLEKGEITRLAIFMPPRHGKTMLASEFFSAWYLGRNPSHEIIFTTFSQDRADDVGKAVRNRMVNEVHEQVFPGSTLKTDAKASRKFFTEKNGVFYATGWGGIITGRGANCQPAGTMIETEIGKIPIEILHDMEAPPRVLSIDKDGQPCFQRIICSKKTYGKDVYESETIDGKRICGTADHLYYSDSRGFTRLSDIRVGETLVSGKFISETSRSTEIFDPSLCPLPKAFYQDKCRCEEEHSKWPYGCLLLCDLLEGRSCNKEQSKVCQLWGSPWKNKNRRSFWRDLLQKLFKVHNAFSTTTQNKMRRVWSLVLASKQTQTILLKVLCRVCPLKKDEGESKLALQRWIELYETFLRNETIDSRTRQFSMCCLRNGGEEDNDCGPEIKIKHVHPSHKHGSGKQQGHKSCFPLYSLPLHSAQIKRDFVSMAPRLYKRHVEVYDLQIEETHSFFANEILVHNCLILDDLLKDRADAMSKINRRKREEWFTSTAYSRLMPDENVENGRILLIMTRWAYDDIASFLLKDLAHEGWHVLNCPAISEEDDILGREIGEALWPDFRPLHVLENIKKSVSPEDWNALYQQRPLPVEGGMIKTNWFRRYDMHEMHQIEDLLKAGQTLPERLRWFQKIVISLDTAYKPNQINDPTGFTVWGYNKNTHYLLEAGARRLEYPDLKTVSWRTL